MAFIKRKAKETSLEHSTMWIKTDKDVVDAYHKWYYANINWRKDITYLGVPTLKSPMDLWTIQELIVANRPNVIIETGTAWGGSALFYSALFEQLGRGTVISVDIGVPSYVPENYQRPVRGNIFYIQGDSSKEKTKLKVIDIIAKYVEYPKVMVMLDSCHAYWHVVHELDLFSPLVTTGQYLIVEDTNTDLVLPTNENVDARKAAQQWLSDRGHGFVEDKKCAEEKWGFSFNKYYRRTK